MDNSRDFGTKFTVKIYGNKSSENKEFTTADINKIWTIGEINFAISLSDIDKEEIANIMNDRIDYMYN